MNPVNDYLLNYMRAFTTSNYLLKLRGFDPATYDVKQAVATLQERNFIDLGGEI